MIDNIYQKYLFFISQPDYNVAHQNTKRAQKFAGEQANSSEGILIDRPEQISLLFCPWIPMA